MKKTIVCVIMSLCILFLGVNPIDSKAASSGTWNIQYIPFAPSTDSNQSDRVYVAFDSDGYYANCTSFSGVNGAMLTITATGDVSMSPVYITRTGRTNSWDMIGSTNSDVTFIVSAKTSYKCSSTGTIVQIN